MRLSIPLRALTVAAVVLLAACGGGDPITTTNNGSIRGTVTDNSGATVANVAVQLTGNGQAARTTNSGTDGAYIFADVLPGAYSVTVTPPSGFTSGAAGTVSVTVAGGAQANAALVLNRSDLGEWGLRAQMIENNSEFALAESNGKLYVIGGYPPQQGPNRTKTTVQVYDMATDKWQLGPPLPQPNNHGMAAAVGGKIYMIGGQTTDDQNGATAVNTVYELDPAVGTWVLKAPMPTARSGGVAVAHAGKIYVAGGRVPQGNNFAAYDVAVNQWETLPDLPSQRNHITGAAIKGRIHIVGGRLGNGLSPLKSSAHEVFNPQTRTWTTAAPMLSGRSGINGVVAQGCFHVWGGESPTGMSPQHEYYDSRNDTWSSLPNMPIPVHGVVGSAFANGLIWVTGGGIQIGGSSGTLYNQTYLPKVKCE